jgi:alkylation response protein AidB-like acyl-CoA dehydrogenase
LGPRVSAPSGWCLLTLPVWLFRVRSKGSAFAATIPLSVNGKDVRILGGDAGRDGKGFDIMMGIVLPVFNVLNAACSVGLMDGGAETAEHASGIRHSDTGATLADLPTIETIARMRVKTDTARTLLDDTIPPSERIVATPCSACWSARR